MKNHLLLTLSIIISINLFPQVEIPSTNCMCKIIHKKQFSFCFDSLSYQTIWTSNKIYKSDIETHMFFPPDKDFFPELNTMNFTSWTKLENQVKYWSMEFDSLFVLTGKVFIKCSNDSTEKLYFYKAILKGCMGDAIGFLMRDAENNPELISYAVPVDSLEVITGYDFFPGLNHDLQAIIESSFNTDFWPVSVP